MLTTLIAVGALVLIVLWVISVQRNLVNKDERCQNAMSQIGVQQSSRWDALTALVDLVKSYNEHEYNTLRDVIAARKGINATSSAEDVETQEKAIQNALAQINVVAEQYPDLKANENYREIMNSVNTYENQVRMSRMVYNDTVTIYNGLVRMFPSSFVASMFGFSVRTYLEVAQQKTEMPSMKI